MEILQPNERKKISKICSFDYLQYHPMWIYWNTDLEQGEVQGKVVAVLN